MIGIFFAIREIFASTISRGTKPDRVQDFLCFITSGFRPTSTKTERSSKKQSHYEGMPRGTWVMDSLAVQAGPGLIPANSKSKKQFSICFSSSWNKVIG